MTKWGRRAKIKLVVRKRLGKFEIRILLMLARKAGEDVWKKTKVSVERRKRKSAHSGNFDRLVP